MAVPHCTALSRLSFNNIGGKIKYLTLTERNKVWMPDTFFRNEKDAKFHDIIQPNLYVRVFPDGDVLYSIRVSLTLGCPMDLALFPLDTQTCHLTIASYGWASNDVLYQWKVRLPCPPGGPECSAVTRHSTAECWSSVLSVVLLLLLSCWHNRDTRPENHTTV